MVGCNGVAHTLESAFDHHHPPCGAALPRDAEERHPDLRLQGQWVASHEPEPARRPPHVLPDHADPDGAGVVLPLRPKGTLAIEALAQKFLPCLCLCKCEARKKKWGLMNPPCKDGTPRSAECNYDYDFLGFKLSRPEKTCPIKNAVKVFCKKCAIKLYEAKT